MFYISCFFSSGYEASAEASAETSTEIEDMDQTETELNSVR